MTRIIELCKECDKCPVVEISDTQVKIGEKGNLCVLTKEQFETLKEKIKAEEL